MFFLDELKDFKLLKTNFILPIDEKNKTKNSLVALMTPNYASSLRMINFPLMSKKYFKSYYTERAAMYYISDGSVIEETADILLEDIRSILKDDATRELIFSGYENDVLDIQRVMTVRYFDEVASKYGISLQYPIYIDVSRRRNISRMNTEILYVNNKGSYNKALKNYDAYLRFCVVEYTLKRARKKIDPALAAAICLYESGLYDIHKSNWIFNDKLRSLTTAVAVYIARNGYKKFTKEILMGDQRKILTSTIDYFLAKSAQPYIELLFGAQHEESDMLIESASERTDFVNGEGQLQIGEECIMIFQEDSKYNTTMRRLLYNDRIKNLSEMRVIYEKVKKDLPFIKYTYNTIDLYKGLNLFVDFSRYNESFIKNNTFKNVRGYEVYFELMTRLLNDKRFHSYKHKTVIIPVLDWMIPDNRVWMITDNINPISVIYQTLYKYQTKLQSTFKDTIFLFVGQNGYFKYDTKNPLPKNGYQLYLRCIQRLTRRDFVPENDPTEKESSPKAITSNIVDKIEKSQGLEINDLSGEKKEKSVKKEEPKVNEDKDQQKPNEDPKELKDEEKTELVKKVKQAAEINKSEDVTLDELDKDDHLKQILADLSADADKKTNISAARASRIIKMKNDLMDKQFKGKPLKELLDAEVPDDAKPLPKVELNIDSVNEEWKDLSYISSFEAYNPDEDIVKMFLSLEDMDPPLYVNNIEAVDASTSEDVIDTYNVQYEDTNGKRFTIKVDIPKFVDSKYMILRGNRKDISSQLFLMPICKTAEDTVQIISNYNKIFVYRFGNSLGKSNETCDRLVKTISKNKFKNLKVIEGDNSRICARYELPIDYVDLASAYTKFITPSLEIYFNQEELREKLKDKIDPKAGVPIGIYTKSKEVIYYNGTYGNENQVTLSNYIALLLSTDNGLSEEGFFGIYEKAPRSVRYAYSRVKMLGVFIPLIVVCAYSEGLTKVLNKAGINYRIEDNRKSINHDTEDSIKFQDAYLIYESTYDASLLMNGLKTCNTESYSIAEINSKPMYLDFLDEFGGRIKADGLDNFYNLMIDKPIIYDILQYYKLPTDYVEVLLYANRLLVDNKFVSHTNLTGNRRIRRNEQIPAMLYKVLADAYGRYCTSLKHGRNELMSIKQTAVIDEVLLNSTTSDKSIINALNEYEAYTLVTPKGPSGMNSDRAFTLDKRSYDDSMFNVLSMATGFAANVGISRQVTIDSNIDTVRGYINTKEEDMNQLSPTKSFSMTEALTPFGPTRDDPFRSAMNYVQTSRHMLRCKRSNPGLITSGADEALPYMISNLFAKKADKDGTIVSINEERMLIEYEDGTRDYVDLTPHVEKNSSSGFYITLKLDTDLKEGKKFKKGEILAYDKESFSSDIGATDNIAYNIGTIAKVAVLNTDEGYEDSAIISESLSKEMRSDIVLMSPHHPIVIPKDTNVYNLVKVGQRVEEGDTLLILQRAYDDDDSNELLKNLVDDEDEITDIGRIPIKSKTTGVVEDIVISRTVDTNELSPSLKKIVTAYEKKVNAKKKEMKEYGIENPNIYAKSTDKLPATGILKNASDCVVIEIYIKYEDQKSVGDKIIYGAAVKGVIKEIFPEGQEPTSEYRPKERVDSLLALGGVNGRMVTSILVSGAIYKYLIELTRQCKDILGIKYDDNLFTGDE